MALFPQYGASPAAPTGRMSAQQQPLLSFNAGKMDVKDKGGDKYLITPDLRKGTITLFRGPDGQLMHFCWKERPSGNVVDDNIIFPDEAVYQKVNTGREGDRVYMMEIAGNRRFFYWMQDKNPDKDEVNMKKVNELTNSQPSDSTSAGGSDMLDIIRNMQQQAGVGGGAGPSVGGSSVPSAGSGARGEQGLNIQNLQSILQNMGFSPQDQTERAGSSSAGLATSAASSSSGSTTATATSTAAATAATAATAAAAAAAATAATATSNPAGGAGSGTAASRGLTSADLERAMMNLSDMVGQAREPPIALSDILNADAVEATGVLDDPAVSRTLIPLLAVGQQNEGELRDILRSPQFKQTLAAMTGFIQVDNFNSIMRSFELDPNNPRSREALARGDAIEAMLQAILFAADARREREARESATKKGPDGARRGGAK